MPRRAGNLRLGAGPKINPRPVPANNRWPVTSIAVSVTASPGRGSFPASSSEWAHAWRIRRKDEYVVYRTAVPPPAVEGEVNKASAKLFEPSEGTRPQRAG